MELLTSWPSKSRRIVAVAVGKLLREGAAFTVLVAISAVNSTRRESFFIGMVIGWFGIGLVWVGLDIGSKTGFIILRVSVSCYCFLVCKTK